VGKLILKTDAKLGSLGYYNKYVGNPPFDRVFLGGDGLANRQFNVIGQDILALRGYETGDLSGNGSGGGTTFAKYTAELRYPLTLNPSSTIYAHAFVQGGNVWQTLSDFRPFDLRRSAGMGLRVFLPMFGTLGFDYGIGFDKPKLQQDKASWTDFGRFSIILGFEPD
jgi:outer membrane protein insertion porin family